MDLRLAALLLALLGIVVGGMVPHSALIYITAFIAGFDIVFLWRSIRDTSGGAGLAALGLTVMVLGGTACLLIPAWLVQLLK